MSSLHDASVSAARPLPSYELHGYAIVSNDGMIADATGNMPPQLRNEADWTYFQSELDLSQLVLVGRRSHEAAPSTGRRKRIVMSRSGLSLEQRDQVWWWNPQTVPLADVLSHLLPSGGRVAVPGGQAVFDLLAHLKAFHAFHLSRAVGINLPGGHPAFSVQASGATLESILRGQELHPAPTRIIDPSPLVTLQVWRRERPAIGAPR